MDADAGKWEVQIKTMTGWSALKSFDSGYQAHTWHVLARVDNTYNCFETRVEKIS